MGDVVLSGSISAVLVVGSWSIVQSSSRKIGTWAANILIYEPCFIKLTTRLNGGAETTSLSMVNVPVK